MHIRLALVGVAVLFPNVSLAGISTDRKVALIYSEAFKGTGRLDQARVHLEDYVKSDSQSVDIWDYLAKTYLQLKLPRQASAAYGEATRLASADQVGAYNYKRASAEAQAGQVENSKAYLKLAEKDPFVRDSARSAVAELRAGQALPAIVPSSPSKWKASGSIKSGYDDNVLLFSETTRATAQRTDAASMVIAPTIEVSHEKPRGGKVFSTSLNLSNQTYSSSKAKSYDSLTAGLNLGLAGEAASWLGLKHRLSNSIKTSYMDSRAYRHYSWDNTLGWKGNKAVHPNNFIDWGLDVRFQQYAQTSGANAVDNRSGWATKPSFNWQTKTQGGNLSAGVFYEHLFAQGNNFKSDTLGIPANLRHSLFWAVTGSLDLTYSYIWYPQSTNDRRDGNLSGTISLQRPIAKFLSASIGYGYSKNGSTVDASNYQRQNIELKVFGETP